MGTDITIDFNGPYYGGLLRQRDMPTLEEAWVHPSIPTLSISDVGNQLTTTLVPPVNGDTVVLLGSMSGVAPVAVDSGYYRGAFVADTGSPTNGNPRQMPAYGFRIKTNATVIEVPMRGRADLVDTGNTSLHQPILVKIDGQWVADYTYLLDTPALGMEELPIELAQDYPIWTSFNFPVGTKEIEIHFTCEIAGFRINSGATLSTVRPIEHTISILGESLSSGLNHMTGEWGHTSPQGNEAYATYTGLTSYFNFIAQSLGYDNQFNGGSSGSGYARNGDTVPYNNTTRLADIIARSPDCIIIGSEGNDYNNSVSAATIASSIATVLATLRGSLPDAILCVLTLGVLDEYSQSATANANMRSAAVTYGAWLFNPYSDGKLYGPTGAVVQTLAPTDMTLYQSNDGLHPSQEGAMIIGKAVSEFIRLCHPA